MTAEFTLLRALWPRLAGDSPDVPLGAGDDAAVVRIDGRDVAIAVDALVDSVHFDLGISSLADVGWKAVAVNVSDMAAVGARATAAVVALQVPEAVGESQVAELYGGMGEAGERWGVAIVGGDVVPGPVLAVSLTTIGPLLGEKPLRRGAAVAGDAVVVAGWLGASAAGLALHRAGAEDLLDAFPELLAAHRRPRALPEVGLALAQLGAHACIDVSDGLGQDAGHVAAASGVRIRIEETSLPVHAGVAETGARLGRDDLAVAGGEDLALVATLAADGVERLADALEGTDVPVRRVGTVEEGHGVVIVAADGTERDASRLGWEHGREGDPK